jgi:hypothetical protein
MSNIMYRYLLAILFLTSTFFVNSQVPGSVKDLRSFSRSSTAIRLVNEEGRELKKEINNPMLLSDGFNHGQRLFFTGSNYMQLKIGENLPKALVYSLPSKHSYINIPEFQKASNGPIEFGGENVEINLNAVSKADLIKYRNLAFNPYDWQQDEVSFFPHIESNSECRGQYMFCARNVINGLTKNDQHSAWEDRSWGPEQIEDPWIDIDFGRLVEIDKVVIYIRADFAHDGFWQSATLAFDDGSEENIKLQKTANAQTFTFSKRKVKSLRITNLAQLKPLKWCALTEVEVWGKEAFPFEIKESWEQTLRTFNWNDRMLKENSFYWQILRSEFPIESDWLMRDAESDLISFVKSINGPESWETVTQKVISKIADKKVQSELIEKSKTTNADWIGLYVEAHQVLRHEFLSILEQQGNEYIFVKRYPFTPSFYAYTEGLSDARSEHSFTPGAALCKATLKNGKVEVETLLEDENGVIRDPDVSYDGKRILFAWKKSYNEDDYHLYELNTEDNSIKQLTFGKYHADFEGKYLPNGDIVFNSSRCEQTVDCWKTEVSNLYLMKNDGRFLRRVGFDQVHTTYPTVMDNGKIVYTRWDYNDRGQTFPQPLFTMNIDGTAQTEYYGNNSWYPTTITHARQIPGTNKVMATFCGHHTRQHGKIGIVDPSKGRQENSGTQLIAPIRDEEPVRVDKYGQEGIQFQFPYPFNEEYFLATSDPINWRSDDPFFLYFMNADGRREVVASDDKFDCKQAVPLAPRTKSFIRPTQVDYTKDKGYYYVQNVYHGPGAKGLKKGTIEKLRVVSIEFRAAPIRLNSGSNDEGGVPVFNIASTPIALGQGAWDVKRVLGEVPVEEDGSAMFEVPARTPVYFQMIDTAGYVAQTMRSWSTLQPGETFSCIGCHEDKNESVPMANKSLAMAKGVQSLQPFYGMNEGFSFRKHVQPILDKNCVSCHNNRHSKMLNEGVNSVADMVNESDKNNADENSAFSLLDRPIIEHVAGREWNDAYLNLLQASYNVDQRGPHTIKGSFKSELVNWPGMQSVPTLLPPYYRGAATSKLMKMLKQGHGKTNLSKKELDIISCWIDLQVPYCGDYKEANIWTEEERKYYDYYLNKRTKNAQEEAENIKALLEYLNPE